MMKKLIFIFILIVAVSPSISSAGGQTGPEMNIGGMNLTTSGAIGKASVWQSLTAGNLGAAGQGLVTSAKDCASQCPHGCCSMAATLFAAGAQAFMGASHNASKASGNAGVVDQFTSGGKAATVNQADLNGIMSDAKAGLASIKDAGYTVDENAGTITGPDGTTQSLASAAAGKNLSPSDLAQYQSKLSDIQAKAMKDLKSKTSKDILGDADASVGSAKAAGGDGMNAGYNFGMGPKGSAINRDPAQVAGLQTTFNGEPIGVSADSIFGIIDRRYNLHEKQGSFLSPVGK